MPVDPRLNCAAAICCTDPPPPLASEAVGGSESRPNGPSTQARIAILIDLGVPEDLAPKVAAKMVHMGIAFLSVELAEAIRHIAFPSTVPKDQSETDGFYGLTG